MKGKILKIEKVYVSHPDDEHWCLAGYGVLTDKHDFDVVIYIPTEAGLPVLEAGRLK